MGHDHQASIGPKQRLYPRYRQGTVQIGLGRVKGDPLGRQLVQGPHDCIVFHGADHHMIPGL